ncbi:hypothetical protein H9P43_008458 [Blastocladiella emersonii ATCC 22665]|nr:hypothetical protein H9P43_008458 [Blastocladiella emersonii ATCC 22665]
MVRPLLKQTVLSVLHRGGVVRSLNNLKDTKLPYRMKAHQEYHEQGQYFSVVFDAAPTEVPTLLRQLKLDARVIRATVVKAGDTLEQISGLPASYVSAAGFPSADSQAARNKRLATVPKYPYRGLQHEWLAATTAKLTPPPKKAKAAAAAAAAAAPAPSAAAAEAKVDAPPA